MAREFAEPLGWAEVLHLAGSLHDIGKVSPEFQGYIAGQRLSGGDHVRRGAPRARPLWQGSRQGARHDPRRHHRRPSCGPRGWL
ncbi:hypothetical protein [Ancylobacter aquaticus]|uniref:hypothetical protein n=1 Tax=Ancylobacter aquaticus TaxID=100 RepID=UPI001404C8F1